MERAKELLATSDLMTYEIAEATGYPDAHYFSTVFKRHIGRHADGVPGAAAAEEAPP